MQCDDSAISSSGFTIEGVCTENNNAGTTGELCCNTGEGTAGTSGTDTSPTDYCPNEDASTWAGLAGFTCDDDPTDGSYTDDKGIVAGGECCSNEDDPGLFFGDCVEYLYAHISGSSPTDSTPYDNCNGGVNGYTCVNASDFDDWDGLQDSDFGIWVYNTFCGWNVCRKTDACYNGTHYLETSDCSDNDECDSDIDSSGYVRDGYVCSSTCVVDNSKALTESCCATANCASGACVNGVCTMLSDGESVCYEDNDCVNLCDEASGYCCPTGDCCPSYDDTGDADCGADKYCDTTYDCVTSLSELTSCIAPRDKMCHSTTSGGDCISEQDGVGTYCSCTSNGCLDDGSCYADTSAHDIGAVVGDGADLEYCSSGTWVDADSSAVACMGVGGVDFYYSSPNSNHCCGDDGANDNFGAYYNENPRWCCYNATKLLSGDIVDAYDGTSSNYMCYTAHILHCKDNPGTADEYSWSIDYDFGHYFWKGNCGIYQCGKNQIWTIPLEDGGTYAVVDSNSTLVENSEMAISLSMDCKYLLIKENKTLTIDGADFMFMFDQYSNPNPYIVLESGAKLILTNGAKIFKVEAPPM